VVSAPSPPADWTLPAPAYLQRFAREQVISINTAAAGGNAGIVAMGDD
jgi:delta 1-pyrroline-5-carboxylate dehydrogenase